MKPFNDYDSVRAAWEYSLLKPGGYVCEIKEAYITSSQINPDIEWLEVLIDIKYGEFERYYEEQYKRNNSDQKRWRGVIRFFIPNDDGSEKDQWTKSVFKGFITSVEESNPGYTWDWDETKLKKKEIGVLFRSEEWEYNGKHGWTTRPFRPCSVGRIEDGKYTVPSPKALDKKENSTNTFSSIVNSEEELPF